MQNITTDLCIKKNTLFSIPYLLNPILDESIILPPIQIENTTLDKPNTKKDTYETILTASLKEKKHKARELKIIKTKYKKIYEALSHEWDTIKHLLDSKLIIYKDQCLKLGFRKKILILIIHVAIVYKGIVYYEINNNSIIKFRVANDNKIFINLVNKHFIQYKHIKNNMELGNYGLHPDISGISIYQCYWNQAFAGEINFVLKLK